MTYIGSESPYRLHTEHVELDGDRFFVLFLFKVSPPFLLSLPSSTPYTYFPLCMFFLASRNFESLLQKKPIMKPGWCLTDQPKQHPTPLFLWLKSQRVWVIQTQLIPNIQLCVAPGSLTVLCDATLISPPIPWYSPSRKQPQSPFCLGPARHLPAHDLANLFREKWAIYLYSM